MILEMEDSMERMPVLFIGHGSPMNAIEENAFSAQWEKLGPQLPKPEAILAVSAHWFTRGTRVTNAPRPKMVYDMYGFPKALYEVVYPAPGSPHFAERTQALTGAQFDTTWGLDHGSWSVLRRLFPQADVPVFQLSVDSLATVQTHYELGKRLRALRNEGVLILGSGNIVHNLARVAWDQEGGFPWAKEFDSAIRNHILRRNVEGVLQYPKIGASAALAFTTLDHFAPLLYALGAADEQDRITVFNDACVLGSLSMTSYLFA